MKTKRMPRIIEWLYLVGAVALLLIFAMSFFSQALSVDNASQLPLPGAIISDKDVRLSGHAAVTGDVYARTGTRITGKAKLIGSPRSFTGVFPAIDFEYYKEEAKRTGTYHVGNLKITDRKKTLASPIFVEGGNVEIGGKRLINATIITVGRIEVLGQSTITWAENSLALVAKKNIRICGK